MVAIADGKDTSCESDDGLEGSPSVTVLEPVPLTKERRESMDDKTPDITKRIRYLTAGRMCGCAVTASMNGAACHPAITGRGRAGNEAD